MKDVDSRLAARLGYRFSDSGLLEHALTHRSAGPVNNERLEFLGDAILNLLIAEALYRASPQSGEGPLTRLRAALVRRETLAEVARQLGLGGLLRLGAGELKTGGRDRDSILADALEAVFGAIYLEAGLDTCRELALELFGGRIEEAARGDARKDPKTMLQEALQSRGLPLPRYRVLEVSGDAHDQCFRVECAVEALGKVWRGEGSSRRRAEQEAAVRAIAGLDRPS